MRSFALEAPGVKGGADGRLALTDRGRQLAQPNLADLIAKIAEQDTASFAELFEMVAPRIKRFMLLLNASDSLAEELTQETMLAIWRKAGQFDLNLGGAEGWIFTIARNLRIDAARQRRERGLPFGAADTQGDEPTPEANLLSRERFAQVDHALMSLSAHQQTVLRAVLLHDKPLAQIAHELGIPLSTTKSHLRRGLARLRELIGVSDR